MPDASLQVRRYTDAEAFYDVAEPVLVAREAENCLSLGIIRTLLTHPERYPEAPYLATVTAGERVVGVALRTPPFNLALAAVDAPAADTEQRAVLDALVADVRVATSDGLSGVVGPSDLARDFAEIWSAAVGVAARISRRERIYQLETVIAPPGVPGQMRRAEERDRQLMERWVAAFTEEAEPEERRLIIPSRHADWALSAPVAVHGIALWEVDGQPVSLAGYGNPTPHGMRIGPVYTPPELRGHGYASALTAGVSQFVLEGLGKQRVFLFTDLANPTSNKIYQQIGYQPVSDVLMYAFG